MVATQLGFAMMPRCRIRLAAFTSGTTSGTSGSIWNAEELSTTATAPARTAAGGVALRYTAAGREQRDVDAREAVVRQHLNRHLPSLEAECPAGGPRRGQQSQTGLREAADLEPAQQFNADGAGRADDRDRGCARLDGVGRVYGGLVFNGDRHCLSP
jgi:hypothetical protein